MAIYNGQPVSAETDNTGLLGRNSDTDTTGKIDLLNADSASVTDLQQTINDMKAEDIALQDNIDIVDNALYGHVTSTVNAHEMSAINYDNTSSGLLSSDGQSVVDEVNSRVSSVASTMITHNHDGINTPKIEGANLKSTGVATDYVIKADGSGGVTWGIGGGGGVTTFDELTDTPSTKTGQSGKLLAVNAVENAIEYIAKPVGDSSVWKSWNGEDGTGVASATVGNDATYLNGGTFAGILGYETVAPLHGVKSYKYTQQAGSINDWIASEAVAIPPRAINKITNVYQFVYTYSGNAGDIDIIIYDNTNSKEIRRVHIEAKTGARILFNIPSGCTSVKVGFHTMVENIGAELIFDDVELHDNAFGSGESVVTNSIMLEGNDGRAITGGTEDIQFSGTGNGWTSSGDNNYYTVQYSDSIVNVSCSTNWTATNANYLMIYIDTGSGFSLYKRIGEYVAGETTHLGKYTSKKGEFLVGTKISIRAVNSNTLANSVSLHYLNVVETATAPNILHSDERMQAHHVGDVFWAPTVNHIWQTNSTSWTTFPADTDAPVPVVTGDITVPNGDIPTIIISNVKTGRYIVKAFGGMIYRATSNVAFRFYDGTNSWGATVVYPASDAAPVIIGEFNVTSTSDITLQFQGRAIGSGATAEIYNNGDYGDDGFRITVEYLPPSTEKSVATTIQIPVGGDDNNLSARILAGTSPYAYSYSHDFIDNVVRNAVGDYTVTFKSGYFSLPPIITGSSEVYYVDFSVNSVTTTSCNIRLTDNGTTNNGIDVAFTMYATRVLGDRKNPNTYVGEVAPNAHITGGTEYLLPLETWNGKPVYARSYEITSNISTITTIGTIDTSLIPINSNKLNTTEYLISSFSPYMISSTDRSYALYNESTGVVSIVASGRVVYAGSSLTIKYIKP